MRYVPYHVHTTYSVLDGMIKIEDYVRYCREVGLKGCGVTDHANFHGAVKFWDAAKSQGLKPIIGCEFNIVEDAKQKTREYAHIVVIVLNKKGWENAVKLTHLATQHFYYKPRIDVNMLLNHSDGLAITTACIGGYIPKLILSKQKEYAFRKLEELKEAFEGRLFVEVQEHGIKEEREVNEVLVDFARKLKLPVVFNPDAHYLLPEHRELHSYLLKIRTGDEEFALEGDNYYLDQNPKNIPQEFLENTFQILDLVSEDDVFDTTVKIPQTDHAIKDLLYSELKKRGLGREYRERLDYEVGVIEKMGFLDYFAVLHDIVSYARSVDIAVGVGRGSGAGSLVAYLLGITNVDPVKYNLLFERFLNPEKVTIPDIDVDFEHERRQEIIDYVSQKYNTIQIITFSRFSGKSQVNDLRRVGAPEERIGEYAEVMEDLVRHTSIHASGVLVLPKDKFVPITKVKDTLVSQWDMEDLDRLKYLKFDFLGLKTLTIIKKVLGTTDYSSIPLDDAEVFENVFAKGDTYGVFQFESQGMRELLREVRPRSIDELSVCNALYRPGTLQSGLVDKYIRHEPLDMPDVVLNHLEDTRGVLVYQEQVMTLAHKVGGLTMPETDILRKAISKRKIEDIERFRDKFVANASKVIGEDKASELFNIFVNFGEYAFNKSHSVSYSIIAYITAYLKYRYTRKFYQAVFSVMYDDTEYVQEGIWDALRHGVEVYPPDLLYVDAEPIEYGNGVMLGLLNVKGVEENFVRRITKVKGEGGRLTWQKVALAVSNSRVFEIISTNCTIGGERFVKENYSETQLFGLQEGTKKSTTKKTHEPNKPCFIYTLPQGQSQYQINEDETDILSISPLPFEYIRDFILPTNFNYKFVIAGRVASYGIKDENKLYKHYIILEKGGARIRVLFKDSPGVSVGDKVAFLCSVVGTHPKTPGFVVGNIKYSVESVGELFKNYLIVFDEAQQEDELDEKLTHLKSLTTSNGMYRFLIMLRKLDGELVVYEPNPNKLKSPLDHKKFAFLLIS